jgi:uncharacterized lipoprotein YmbA
MKGLASALNSLAIASILLAGCGSVLAPQQDESRFFILTSAPADSVVRASSSAHQPLSIGLGPVQLPDYLQRKEIVTRAGPNRLAMSDTDRWAEPVGDNFRRVLATDLSTMLDGAAVVAYPWYSSARLDYKVEVEVSHFEPDTVGNTQLACRWRIRDGATNKILRSQDGTFAEPGKAALTADSVAALSADVGDLSKQIARAVRGLAERNQGQSR